MTAVREVLGGWPTGSQVLVPGTMYRAPTKTQPEAFDLSRLRQCKCDVDVAGGLEDVLLAIHSVADGIRARRMAELDIP